jgi:hypothetical protein
MEIRLMKRLATLLLTVSLVMSFATQSFAQASSAGGGGVNEQKGRALGGPRRQLATIIFAGIGGAILGLSTLSFYGRPQDELKNIAYGLAFGVFAGTAYVTYKAASNPQELYGVRPQNEYDLDHTSAFSRPPSAPSGRPLAFNLKFAF